MLEALASQDPRSTLKQKWSELNVTKRLLKVVKMVEKHGFSITAACKEAKTDRVTVKKWLGKQLEKKQEFEVKHAERGLSFRQECQLPKVKNFIDMKQGNVFLKDI